MKKLLTISLVALLFLASFLPRSVNAASICSNFTYSPNPYKAGDGDITFQVDVTGAINSGISAKTNKYYFNLVGLGPEKMYNAQPNAQNIVSIKLPLDLITINNTTAGSYQVELYVDGGTLFTTDDRKICSGTYTIEPKTTNPTTNCTISASPQVVKIGGKIRINMSSSGQAYLDIRDSDGNFVKQGMATVGHNSIEIPTNRIGVHTAQLYTHITNYNVPCGTQAIFRVTEDDPPPGASTNPNADQRLGQICNSVPTEQGQQASCKACFTAGNAWTAIGCIETSPSGEHGFVTVFLRFGVGIAGGIAFLLILWGGFQMITSAGNPEVLNSAKELIGSAIGGLLMIIFSLFLLRLIGFNILGLPGFG